MRYGYKTHTVKKEDIMTKQDTLTSAAVGGILGGLTVPTVPYVVLGAIIGVAIIALYVRVHGEL